MNRPNFLNNTKKKICLICEGYEEYDYIERLLSIGVWSKSYSFDLVNAASNGNISARYQDKYQSDFFDIVLAFCDTDKKPHKDFELIRSRINNIFGIDNAADEVIIFGNPCTMQIHLAHFGDVQLKTQAKKINAIEIEKLTGIKDYKAKEEQRKQLCDKVNKENYELMKQRISKFSTNYKINPSSNFVKFMQYFESSDSSWIDDINNKIEE